MTIDDMPDRELRPDDKLTVKWTEIATEDFEVAATAQELADLMGIEVSDIYEVLTNHDHDLYNDLAEWNGEGGTLNDFQRQDIEVTFRKEGA